MTTTPPNNNEDSETKINATLARWVPINWVKLAQEANARREKMVDELFRTGSLPTKGWEQDLIEETLTKFQKMDSNNFLGNIGAGEREGRVYQNLVKRRHWGMSHGIGRSGDVAAVQPKAQGSSILYKLTQSMTLDLMRRVLGMRSIKACMVLPLATGMSLTLVLLAIKNRVGKRSTALWPRMDQKTCLKSMVSAGFRVRVLDNLLEGDRVTCNVEALELALSEDAAQPEPDIAVVVTTTSCFAPRVPDDVEQIARLCAKFGVAHVINNAYGLQCNKCVHAVEQACRTGRVDAIVQSTDKNFLVPVGGAVVSGPDAKFLEVISKTYPGRASMSPVLDLFITLLSMGREGYESIRKERIRLAEEAFPEMLNRIATKFGVRLLSSPRNTISFAMSLEKSIQKVEVVVGNKEKGSELDNSQLNNGDQLDLVTNLVESNERDVEEAFKIGLQADQKLKFEDEESESFTRFGSMLFTRGVSGARVVARGTRESVAGHEFVGYGSSHSSYPVSYFSVACALGVTAEDVVQLQSKLESTFNDFQKA